MPMVDVTNVVLNEEANEMEEIIKNNPKANSALEQFEAECKLRRQMAGARKQQNIAQKEIRERTGLTQQAISRIERDHEISPSLRNLIKYVDAIGYELTLQPKHKS